MGCNGYWALAVNLSALTSLVRHKWLFHGISPLLPPWLVTLIPWVVDNTDKSNVQFKYSSFIVLFWQFDSIWNTSGCFRALWSVSDGHFQKICVKVWTLLCRLTQREFLIQSDQGTRPDEAGWLDSYWPEWDTNPGLWVHYPDRSRVYLQCHAVYTAGPLQYTQCIVHLG